MRLHTLFDEYNRRFWGGRLPRFSVRRRVPPGHLHGFCDLKRRVISIIPLVTDNPEWVRRILLHEMCHIPSGCSRHGKRFQTQLARLAAHGEAWAEDERQDYADPQRCFKITVRGIRAFMEDWCFGVHPATLPPWKLARVIVAHQHFLSVRELFRRYPQAKQTWARLRAEAFRELRRDARFQKRILEGR